MSGPTLRETGAAIAGMVLLVAAAYFPVLIGSESIYHLDTYFEHVPFWHFAASAVAQGDAPWWTPHIRAGYPLHANGEASLLYPLTLPFSLSWPAHRALSLFAMLHLVGVGAFTWRYLREIEVGPWLAFVGAGAFALSGRMTASTIWPHAVAASCALPLVLLGIERARRDPRCGALLISGAIGLGLLAGRPQRLIPALLFAGAYALVATASTWRRVGRAPAGRLLGTFAGAALLGVAIGAPQVLPTLSLVSDSIWADGVTRSVFESNALGRMSASAVLLPAEAYTWTEGRLYPGVLVYLGIGIGLLGLFRAHHAVRETRALFFVGAAAVCVWLATAGPLAYELCQSLPLVRSLRSPIRFLFPLAFAATMFATLALQGLAERRKLSDRVLAVVAGLACAELVVVCWLTAPTGPSSLYEVRPSVLDESASQERDEVGFFYRSYASGRWISPELVATLEPDALLAQFRALPMTRDLAMRYDRYTSSGYGEPRLAWKDRSYKRLVRNEIDQLGVRRLFMSHRLRGQEYEFEGDRNGTTFVYRNPTPLPRALCVSELSFAADADEALQIASKRDFDPRRTAVVEGDLPADPAPRAASCDVRLKSASPTQILLEARATTAGWLVLFDTWAPGWSADVAGRSVEVRRANGMFRIVPVPEGDSAIEFSYSPPGLWLGVGVAAPASLFWIALLVVARRRQPDSLDPSGEPSPRVSI